MNMVNVQSNKTRIKKTITLASHATLSNAVRGILVAISMLVSIIVATSQTMPSYYEYLWLLPFVYSVCILFLKSVVEEALICFPVLLLVLLYFVRMVISPFLYAYAGVIEQITINVENNTFHTILLICYECIAVFATLGILQYRYRTKRINIMQNESVRRNVVYSGKFSKGDKRLGILLLICIAIIIIFYFITPDIFTGYQTILNIADKDFTSIETDYSNIDSSTFIIKFALVTSNYMLKVLRLLIPAALIYFASKMRNRKIAMLLSAILVVSPIFIIAGAIAMSIYYVIILMYEFVYLYSPKNQNLKLIFVFMLGAAFIFLFWIIRYMTNAQGNASLMGFLHSFSNTVNAYFSGANIVVGIYNLPEDFDLRIRFLYYDVFGSIPYSGTLFGINESDKLTALFNNINEVSGNIPPTIAISYYYFGTVLSPIISILFAIGAFVCGYKYDASAQPIKKITYQLAGLYFALGIIMYNIPIVLGTLVQIVLVLYLIGRICYGKEN